MNLRRERERESSVSCTTEQPTLYNFVIILVSVMIQYQVAVVHGPVCGQSPFYAVEADVRTGTPIHILRMYTCVAFPLMHLSCSAALCDWLNNPGHWSGVLINIDIGQHSAERDSIY